MRVTCGMPSQSYTDEQALNPGSLEFRVRTGEDAKTLVRVPGRPESSFSSSFRVSLAPMVGRTTTLPCAWPILLRWKGAVRKAT